MATSFVEYRKKGFWCDGGYLKLWLYFFVKEAVIEDDPLYKPFLTKVLEQWQFQATLSSGSAVDLCLDELLITKHDKDLLLKIGGKLHRKLVSYGSHIPDALLTDANRNIKGINWLEAPLTVSIAKVGVLFRQLLKGELTIDVSSPLHYLELQRWNLLNLL